MAALETIVPTIAVSAMMGYVALGAEVASFGTLYQARPATPDDWLRINWAWKEHSGENVPGLVLASANALMGSGGISWSK